MTGHVHLSAEQLTEIELLADLCNHHDGIELKLHWEQLRTRSAWESNDFIYTHEGRIVGYLGLFAPNRWEVEVSGMVHPEFRRQGIFQHLFQQASQVIRTRQIPRVVFSVNHVGLSGRGFATAQGARYSYTEYQMVLGAATPLSKGDVELSLDYATTEDGDFFTHCMFLCFDVPEAEAQEIFMQAMTSINRQIYIVRKKGEPIGMIGTLFGGTAVKMDALAILPEYRHQGYGSQAFAQTVHKLLGDGHPNMECTWRCSNEETLGIFLACGFEVAKAYDYYEVAPLQAGDEGENA